MSESVNGAALQAARYARKCASASVARSARVEAARAHHRREPAVPVRPARLAGGAHACRRPATRCRSSARRRRATKRASSASTASTSIATRCRAKRMACSATRSSTASRSRMEFWLSLKILFGRGFDVIHACNPPDTIFLIGGFYKLFGKKFVFDHHDINPELYEAKFGKRGFGRRLLLALERMSFSTADMVISTNESYRCIAHRARRQESAATCSWCARARISRA